MKKNASLLCMLLLAWCTATGAADGSARQVFQVVGTLDRLDLESGEVVIGDILYHLGPNIVVRDPKNRMTEARKLRTGSKVGAHSYHRGSGQSGIQYLYEIHVFPDNFDLDRVAAESD